MADVNSFLEVYGKEVGLPNLKFGENSVCSLIFDSTINVDIAYREDQDQCIFAAKIGDIPVEGKEVLYESLLKANAFGMDTAGASLGIDEENNSIVLSFVFLTQSFSYDLFKTVLNNFVDLVEDWTKKYEELLSASQMAGGSSGASMSQDPMASYNFARV